MAIPIQAQPRYGGREFDSVPLPSISSREDAFGRRLGVPHYRIPFNDNLSPSAASNPMEIRNTSDDFAPPPLPPPQYVPVNGPVDPNIQGRFGETGKRRGEYGNQSVDSLGFSFERRDLSFKRDFTDEGYQSIDSMRFVYAL